MRRMSLAEIMDNSMDILRRYIKTIIMFQLGYGAVILFSILGVALVGGILTSIIFLTSGSIPILITIVILLCLFIIPLFITNQVGIIKVTSQEFSSEKVYASKAIEASFKSIIKVTGVFSIIFISYLPVLAIFGAPIYFLITGNSSSSSNSESSSTAQIIGIIIILILFLVYLLAFMAVTLIYATVLSFSLNVLVIENKGSIQSIKRGLFLLKHRFWKIYGCALLIALNTLVIKYSLMALGTLAVGILFIILKFLNLRQDFSGFMMTFFNFFNGIVTLISWCIITPIGTIALTLQYYNERFNKEGYDLILRLKEIQKSEDI